VVLGFGLGNRGLGVRLWHLFYLREKRLSEDFPELEARTDLRFASRVQGSGFRVQGSGFRVQGSGSMVQGNGFRV